MWPWAIEVPGNHIALVDCSLRWWTTSGIVNRTTLYANDASHNGYIIMSTIVFQITSLTIVYSTVHSGADHGKHKSSASLAFVRGNDEWPMNSPHKRFGNTENVSISWRHHVNRGMIMKTRYNCEIQFMYHVSIPGCKYSLSQWQDKQIGQTKEKIILFGIYAFKSKRNLYLDIYIHIWPTLP